LHNLKYKKLYFELSNSKYEKKNTTKMIKNWRSKMIF